MKRFLWINKLALGLVLAIVATSITNSGSQWSYAATDNSKAQIVGIDNMLKSTNDWKASQQDLIKIEDGQLIFKSAEEEWEGVFNSVPESAHILSFKAKIDFPSTSNWVGFSIRQADPEQFCYGTTSYFIAIKPTVIELQRRPADSSILQQVPNTFLNSGEWHDIQWGAINLPEGVNIILKVDGNVVLDFIDTAGAITEEGHFGVHLTPGHSISLKKIDTIVEPAPTPEATPAPVPDEAVIPPNPTKVNRVMVNGFILGADVPPQRINDRLLVPLRAIFEALGATVDWDEATQTATGTLGENTVKVVIDSTDAVVNGEAKALDVPAKIIDDRTLVPVRFISESLGAKVVWDENTTTAVIELATSSVVSEEGHKTYGADVLNDETKPINIVFFGGSITEGGNYSFPLVKNYFKVKYKDRIINSVNAGIGGTGTDLGLFRLKKDVISKNPDVVFIEFAVNDGNSQMAKANMECIVQQLINLPHQPVIIFLYAPTKNMNTTSVGIMNHQMVADYYGIGSIDISSYVHSVLDTNEETDTKPKWADWFDAAGVHPNIVGGKAYADYIISQINENPDDYFKKLELKPISPDFGNEFNNPVLISAADAFTSNELTTTGSWAIDKKVLTKYFKDGVLVCTPDGGEVTFKFTGHAFGIFGIRGSTAGYMPATITIDGDSYGVTQNYTNTNAYPLFYKTNLTNTEHTVTITATEKFAFGYFMLDE